MSIEDKSRDMLSIRLLCALDDVRHVFVRPENEDAVREEMRTRGVDKHAELHVDRDCSYAMTFWCPEIPSPPPSWLMSLEDNDRDVIMMAVIGRLIALVPGAKDDPILKLCGDAIANKPGALCRLMYHMATPLPEGPE